MAIKLQGLETDLKVNTSKWDAGFKGAIALSATLLASIAALGAGIFKLGEMTFDWAGDMDSLQDVMGGTNKEAAALNFVLRKSGTETEKLTTAMTVLEKGLIDANGELDVSGKKLAEFGISALDANGTLKDNATIIQEVSDKYNSYGTQTERVNLLTELFGKSGAGLIDVFDTLQGEGGIEGATKKVTAFGLAIDPAKYEKFQRNIEEIKLAGLGMAVTFVDTLMPAVEGFTDWWETEGVAATQSMVKWLGTNIPVAVNNSKKTWEIFTTYLDNNVDPVMQESSRLIVNVDTVLKSLNAGLSLGRILWQSILMAMSPVITMYSNITQSLQGLAGALSFVNQLLESGIGAANRARAAAGAPVIVPNISTGSTGSTGGGARSGRAWGGAMLAGQPYDVFERGSKSEAFVPNVSGNMQTQMKLTLSDRDTDRIGQAAGDSVARRIAPLMQRRVLA